MESYTPPLRRIKKEFTGIVLGGLIAFLGQGMMPAYAADAQQQKASENEGVDLTPAEKKEFKEQVVLFSYVASESWKKAIIEHNFRELTDAAIEAILKEADPNAKYLNLGGAEHEKNMSVEDQFHQSMKRLQYMLFEAKTHAAKEGVTIAQLAEKGLKGMLKWMDPHSDYMNPKEWKGLIEHQNSSFFGVGMELTMSGKLPKVQKVIEGQPAETAGVKDGDLITAIDGKSTEDLGGDLGKVVDAIRGPRGTEVTLDIRRQEQKLSIAITRDRINVDTVKTRMIETEKGRVGLIHIATFSSMTHDHFINGTDKLKSSPEGTPDYYILDLRNNTGGDLRVVGKIADEMLDKGVIYNYVTRNGERVTEANNGDRLEGKPLIVLTNNFSASASEILSGALKDNGRAIVMNDHETTFGKGTGQEVIPLYNATAGMKLTTFYFATPAGSPHRHGIKPDIKVDLSETAKPKLVIPADTPPEEAEKMKKAFEKNQTLSEMTQEHTLPINEKLLRHDKDPAQTCTVREDAPDAHYTIALKDIKTAHHQGDPDTAFVDETLACAIEKILGISERSTLKPYVKQVQGTSPASTPSP
ncbi:MAG: S41 family peptidase [Proteobacteria bacterium]|nr:S41 family peptidase [Pseudomonadota bacterium]